MTFPQHPTLQDFLDAVEEALEAGNGPSNISHTLENLLYKLQPDDALAARNFIKDFFASRTPSHCGQLAKWLFHAPAFATSWEMLAAVQWATNQKQAVVASIFYNSTSGKIDERVQLLRMYAGLAERWSEAAQELADYISEIRRLQTDEVTQNSPVAQAEEVWSRLTAYADRTLAPSWNAEFREVISRLPAGARRHLLTMALDDQSLTDSTAALNHKFSHHIGIIHSLLATLEGGKEWEQFDQIVSMRGSPFLSYAAQWRAGKWEVDPSTLALQEKLNQRAVQGEISPKALTVIRLSKYGEAMTGLPMRPELNPGEAWSDAFLAKLDALPDAERAPWPALAAFARSASAGKPSAKWLKEAHKHLDTVREKNFREVLTAALPLLSRPRTFPLQPVRYGPDSNLVLDNFNALSLKGLLWMVPLVADSALTRLLPGVVESALKKVPGVGPREPKVANAAVYALGQIDSEVALSALARLSTTVTFKGTLKEVQKALEVVSKRLNISPDELLDMGVPTLGMQTVGERIEVLGDAEARLSVDADGAKLTFSKGGKVLKSVPAAVKKDFADDLKELKVAQKEAEQAASALAQRLDSLMIQPREWQGESWLERYLNHPLAGTVARRLIWLVDGVPAFWADGDLRDLNGEPVAVQPESVIKLWHPIGRTVEEVLAWRNRLDALEVRQPFKQAWREVYVLTDAERRTDTYSNRFAGHILKQHQFHALAALRGWRNKLRLMVDDSYPPAMRDLPAYGLRAEYWIEGIGEHFGEDSTDSGTYLRLTTDQVRFYPIDAPENYAHAGGGRYSMWVNQTQQPVNPLPLEDIPPLVLSEVLRDVDLFVGVASVGNDPTWQDGGPGGRFRDYWHSYSFGELNETAKTRAEYLKRLIPRLKIKDRLTLDGKFLKVRGDVKTYKIHLGSSNILMEPNDQYLCIIPGGKDNGPDVNFDGDRVLSLVLSKAFLLADDTSITDPVILQQLRR